MGNRARYKVSEVADALFITGGRVAGAAAALGCHERTVTRYLRRHPELRVARARARAVRRAA